ncbi:MAG: DUF5916 domain-containing protein [Candidatus Krumholzibacteriia bacterium]
MRIKRPCRSIITRCLVLMACAWIPASAACQDKPSVPAYHPELRISRASGPIKIDGDLNDAGWRGVAKAANFAENSPGNQTKPAVDTEVLITYDDKNLYVAWLCYDNPAEVRASFCERDKIFSDDYVILMIDTYGEATHAYELAVNPYGIPGDLLFSSACGEDSGYDVIFQSSGRISDNGWVAEMAIPFASLRFPDREEQVWRVDFFRNRPRESRYKYSWAAYNRDDECLPCQWGTVTGISGITGRSGLDLLPAVVAHESGSLGDDGHFENGDIKGDVALGITYDVSSEMSVEATINPDFSQVETDEAQIDVNSTFALNYPEKRPFFQEGSDLFSTYFSAVYTRSINDPIAAGKLTWRRGANSAAFLTARDEHSGIILPLEEQSEFAENGRSHSNILRVKHDLGKQSHLGLLATNRIFDGGGMGSLAGVDGQIRLSKSNSFKFQALASHTEEVDNPALVSDSAFNASRFGEKKYTAGLDGERYWGHAFLGELGRSTSSYSGSVQYYELSPTFRADNGFEPGNNMRQGEVELSGIKRFENSKVLEYVNFEMNVAREWNFDGWFKKDEWINPNIEVKFRTAQTGMHANYMASNEHFMGTRFNGIWGVHNCISTKPWDALSFSGNVNYGHRIARRAMVMGKQLDYGLSVTLKPLDRLLISTSYGYTRSDDVNTGEQLFSQSVFWSRLSLQVSRELSMRLVSQYNDRQNTWDFDPLVTYRINSLTMFYVGSTHNYRDFDLKEDGREDWGLADRQFFLKLQYLFRI